MRNRYVNRSRISGRKFRQLVKLFSLGLDGVQIAILTHLNRNTVNRYFYTMRTRIAEFCELVSPLKGEVENDESYFITSLFQTQSLVLLKILSDYDKSIPVYFLNTGFPFPSTMNY